MGIYKSNIQNLNLLAAILDHFAVVICSYINIAPCTKLDNKQIVFLIDLTVGSRENWISISIEQDLKPNQLGNDRDRAENKEKEKYFLRNSSSTTEDMSNRGFPMPKRTPSLTILIFRD